MKNYRICKAKLLFRDRWTYGEWRQFVLPLNDDGESVCVRMSRLPFTLNLISLGLFVAMTVGTQVAEPGNVIWPRYYVLMSILAALMFVSAVFHLAGYALVKDVGPINRGNERTMPGKQQ